MNEADWEYLAFIQRGGIDPDLIPPSDYQDYQELTWLENEGERV